MKVIVNADDFGASESVNEAVDYAFRNGIINRTTIMVTSPCCEDAMNRAFNGNYAGSVGLHLHLDGGGKRSLTQGIREHNLSSPSFWKKTRNRIFIPDRGLRNAIRAEIEAQMQRYVELGCTLMHIDSHHHRHLDLSILMLVIPLAKKYGFKSMRISRNVGPGLGGIKGLLKKIVNFIIKMNFQTTDYFCGYRAYKALKVEGSKTIEIEVHPAKKGDLYVDSESGLRDGNYNTLDSLSF